jgi:hypothetical protein
MGSAAQPGRNFKAGDAMTRSESARKAGLARAKQFTRESQRHARKHLTSAQAAENGRAGARATIARFGEEFFFEQWRRWKLDHPSRLELLMIGALSRLKINFEREHRLGASLFTLDFYLLDHGCGIEVNGSIHDPGKPDHTRRQLNESRKRRLCAELDIPVLNLHHSEFAELRQVITKLQRFIITDGKEG